MRSLADFEFNKAPLCEGMILACEAIRRDFPSQDVYDELERLVSLAKEEISQLLPLEEQLEKLIALFYGDWGFKASRGVYRLSDALWLDQVLKNQCGIIRCGFIMGRESSRFAAAAGDFPYAADIAH